MYNNEIISIMMNLQSAQTAITAGKDPADAIKAALESATDLKKEAVGDGSTQYTYKCSMNMCGNERCKKIIFVKLADPTICEGTGKSGDANFDLVKQDQVSQTSTTDTL